MEQILTKQLPVADRPYSQDELRDTRTRSLERLNIGDTMVYHHKCGHFYLAKSGGKKEAAVKSGDHLEDGCCSVCWKVRKTPNEIRDYAYTMLDAFQTGFENKPTRWSRDLIHLENTYYKWLYLDFDRKRGEKGGSRRFRQKREHRAENDGGYINDNFAQNSTNNMDEFPTLS